MSKRDIGVTEGHDVCSGADADHQGHNTISVSSGTPSTGSVIIGALADYAEESSCHGIQYIGGSKYHPVRRIIWFFLFAGGLSGLIIIVGGAVATYNRKPVLTKLSVQYKRTQTFPTVTICNLNNFRKSAVSQTPALLTVLRYIYPLTDDDANQNVNWSDPKYAPYMDGSTYVEFARNAGHKLGNMIYSGYYGGKALDVKNEFIEVITDAGICFQFNSNGTLNTSRSGTDNGLWLRLNAEHYDYYFGASNSAGMKVLLHNHDEVPLVKEFGFAIGVGQETFVSLQVKEIKSLPPPYEGGTCVNTTDPNFVNHLSYYDTYSFSGCRRECLTNYTKEICGCTFFYDPGPGPMCNPQEMSCVRQSIEAYTSDHLSTIEDACNCFVPCNEKLYEYRTSSASYPGNQVLPLLMAKYKITKEIARDNYLELRIFYEKLNYDLVEQIPSYGEMDLFADLGGNMGLCIGASLLTAAELLEHVSIAVFRVMFNLCCRAQQAFRPRKIEVGVLT